MSSFEIRLYTFVFFVFFCCILMSLISLTVTTYTLCPLSTIKWLMCENGMSPRVPLRSKVTCSHAHKTIPWYLSGLYLKISDEHTHNVFGEYPLPPLSQERRVRPISLNSLYGENYFD